MLTLAMLMVRFASNLLHFLLKHIKVEFSLKLSATVLHCDVSHILKQFGI